MQQHRGCQLNRAQREPHFPTLTNMNFTTYNTPNETALLPTIKVHRGECGSPSCTAKHWLIGLEWLGVGAGVQFSTGGALPDAE